MFPGADNGKGRGRQRGTGRSLNGQQVVNTAEGAGGRTWLMGKRRTRTVAGLMAWASWWMAVLLAI